MAISSEQLAKKEGGLALFLHNSFRFFRPLTWNSQSLHLRASGFSMRLYGEPEEESALPLPPPPPSGGEGLEKRGEGGGNRNSSGWKK